MAKKEAEELAIQIAEACDAVGRDLKGQQFIEALKLGKAEIPSQLSEQDQFKLNKVIKEGRERISCVLAEKLSLGEVCDIAAKYIHLATVYKRLSVARGEKLLSDRSMKDRLRGRVSDSQQRIDELRKKNALIPSTVRREQAKRGGLAKHSMSKKAREFVKSEWAQHRDVYKGNKSEFARIYAKRVRNEFADSKGEPLGITERTIREVWLSDTLSAGKPAG